MTPSHLIMGRRVLNLPDVVCHSNGDEDYNISHSSLNRKMKHFQMILDHFWMRWRKEYLLSLRDCHRYSKGTVVKKELHPGDVVVMYDDSHHRGFWRLARVQKLMTGVDGQTRGAVIRVQSKGEKGTTTLRRPVSHLYPLETTVAVRWRRMLMGGQELSIQ